MAGSSILLYTAVVMQRLTLKVLPQNFAICRLNPDAEIPGWASESAFFSITRTEDELSVLCPEQQLPPAGGRPKDPGDSPDKDRHDRHRDEAASILVERNRRALQVEGPLDFSLTGVLSSLTAPLAEAGISVFAISTYNTDYLLVKQEQFEEAIGILGGYCEIIVNG